MKNTMCLALIVLAILPASAQMAPKGNCLANGDAPTGPGWDYAARVDGLLREVHASLHRISERMEAGDLTPEQERELKLAATREMISRLDAISAVYDARLSSAEKGCTDAEASNGNQRDATPAGRANTQTEGTVSVKELKRETAAAVATPRSSAPGAEGAAR